MSTNPPQNGGRDPFGTPTGQDRATGESSYGSRYVYGNREPVPTATPSPAPDRTEPGADDAGFDPRVAYGQPPQAGSQAARAGGHPQYAGAVQQHSVPQQGNPYGNPADHGDPGYQGHQAAGPHGSVYGDHAPGGNHSVYGANPGYRSAPPSSGSSTNVLAIIAFVTSLVGMAIIPVVLGHIALSQIRRTDEGGSVFAIIALVFGYLQIALYLLAFLLIPGAIIWSVT